MSDGDSDGENAMFWFNLVGITLATVLLGSFFLLYGDLFLAFLLMMFGGGPNIPDR